MKTRLFTLCILFLTACADRNSDTTDNSHSDTIFKYDTIYIDNQYNWQQGVGLTHNPETDSVWGKPVKFYIDNPKCSPIALDFYQGQFRPTDNNTTASLLKLVTTDDNNLCPFYRWCLNSTIQMQDGALAEYTGVPARQYAEKFPKEFFQYMDTDTSLVKYKDWVASISYSGFYDNEDDKKAVIIRRKMTAIMKKNCMHCDNKLLNRIDTLVKDCFPQTITVSLNGVG